MNAGFLIYSAGVAAAAFGLRALIGAPSAVALGINAAATLGVWSTPLGESIQIDRWHLAFAASGYAALVLAAGLASVRFRRQQKARQALIALAVGVVTATSLLAVLAGTWNGLFQRIGLSTSDIWLIGLAASTLKPPPNA